MTSGAGQSDRSKSGPQPHGAQAIKGGRIAGVRSRQTRLTRTTTRCPCLERGSHRQTPAVCIGPVTAVWHGIAGAGAIFARSKALGRPASKSRSRPGHEGFWLLVGSHLQGRALRRTCGHGRAPSLSLFCLSAQRVQAGHVASRQLCEDALGRSLGLAGYNFLYVIKKTLRNLA
jgi:hypothetical protein